MYGGVAPDATHEFLRVANTCHPDPERVRGGLVFAGTKKRAMRRAMRIARAHVE